MVVGVMMVILAVSNDECSVFGGGRDDGGGGGSGGGRKWEFVLDCTKKNVAQPPDMLELLLELLPSFFTFLPPQSNWISEHPVIS